MKRNISSNVNLNEVFNLNAALKDTDKLHSAWRKEQRTLMATLNDMWHHSAELIPLYSQIGVLFAPDKQGRITKKIFQAAITDALADLHQNMYGSVSADNGGTFVVTGYWSKRAVKDEAGEYVLTDEGKKTYEPKFVPVTTSWSELTIWKMLLQSKSFHLDATVDEVVNAAA